MPHFYFTRLHQDWWHSTPSCDCSEMFGCLVGLLTLQQDLYWRKNKQGLSCLLLTWRAGCFPGQLNPLSSRSLIESCVIPVLMYGSESWTLSKTLLNKLESFQAEVGKRILKFPKSTSNTIPLLALNLPTMCAHILCSKISYLLRICNDQEFILKSQTFNAVAAWMCTRWIWSNNAHSWHSILNLSKISQNKS